MEDDEIDSIHSYDFRRVRFLWPVTITVEFSKSCYYPEFSKSSLGGRTGS